MPGRAAPHGLAGRVAYVHHGRLFTLDDESAWPGERAALARTLELAHEVGASTVLATTGPAGALTTWEQALSAFAAAYEPLAARADTLGSPGVRGADERAAPGRRLRHHAR